MGLWTPPRVFGTATSPLAASWWDDVFNSLQSLLNGNLDTTNVTDSQKVGGLTVSDILTNFALISDLSACIGRAGSLGAGLELLIYRVGFKTPANKQSQLILARYGLGDGSLRVRLYRGATLLWTSANGSPSEESPLAVTFKNNGGGGETTDSLFVKLYNPSGVSRVYSEEDSFQFTMKII